MNISLQELKALVGQLTIENYILKQENQQLREMILNEKVNRNDAISSNDMGTPGQHTEESEQTQHNNIPGG